MHPADFCDYYTKASLCKLTRTPMNLTLMEIGQFLYFFLTPPSRCHSESHTTYKDRKKLLTWIC